MFRIGQASLDDGEVLDKLVAVVFRGSQISQLEGVVVVSPEHQYVSRFQISMDDFHPFKVEQPLHDLVQHFHHLSLVHRLLRRSDELTQRLICLLHRYDDLPRYLHELRDINKAYILDGNDVFVGLLDQFFR